MTKNEAVFTKDMENRKLTVVRPFDAPLEKVWQAWTNSKILDEWWAPKPYKAETKSQDFKEGGRWLYCMAGPTGDRQWCRVDYTAIQADKSINATAMFCDETGNENKEMPRMHWLQEFSPVGDNTRVTVTITFDKAADMEYIIKMGFQEGFTMGLNNLDEYLANN